LPEAVQLHVVAWQPGAQSVLKAEDTVGLKLW